MSQIRITISGEKGVGKTALGWVIADLCKGLGIPVDWEGDAERVDVVMARKAIYGCAPEVKISERLIESEPIVKTVIPPTDKSLPYIVPTLPIKEFEYAIPFFAEKERLKKEKQIKVVDLENYGIDEYNKICIAFSPFSRAAVIKDFPFKDLAKLAENDLLWDCDMPTEKGRDILINLKMAVRQKYSDGTGCTVATRLGYEAYIDHFQADTIKEAKAKREALFSSASIE